jgi:hypothetical protein
MMNSLLMGNVYNSAECKTVITVMITVMSSMDPHMISRHVGWFRNGLDWFCLVRVGNSVTLWCDGG